MVATEIPDYSNGANIFDPQNFASETLSFDATGLTICNLVVYVAIDKDSIGDLQVKIKHENSNTEVTLMNQPGCDNTNIAGDCAGCTNTNFLYDLANPQQNQGVYFADAPVGTENNLIVNATGSCTAGSVPPTPVSSPVPYYLPLGSLDDFTGLDPSGNWTLTVTDLHTNTNGNDPPGHLDCFAISAIPAALSSF